ncbi:phosphatidylserine decarboxylase [Bacteroidia bacterium]|nr:phosphatidylserine decarboxylase [Bacteroidia bacterium]
MFAAVFYTFLLVLFAVIVWFFRMPTRQFTYNEQGIMCPADGRVVIIQTVEEPEYFKDKRQQISVFMSPLNIHVNRYPISGIVRFFRYHEGKYLVAWHPKSSVLNERTTVVIDTPEGNTLLVRQIAGAVARRIVCYANTEDSVQQNQELGFIKFGSRVDIFLPLSAKIKVKVDDVVFGGQTVIAEWGD